MSFALRWIAAFALVALTYNPTDFNYLRWAASNLNAQLPIIILVGLLLLACWVVFFTATWRGIGMVGVVLVLGIVAALVWVLASQGWLSLDNPGLIAWIGVIAVSLVLGVGMTWGILWRRISGQYEVDESSG